MGFSLRQLYTISHNIIDEAVDVYKDAAKSAKKPKYGIMADFDMTHTGTGINNRLYGQGEVIKAKGSISKSGGADYDIPLIMNHDLENRPLGKFRGATYNKFLSGPSRFDWKDYAVQRKNKIVGSPSGVLVGHCNILDEQTIGDVQKGLLTTTSVGMRINDFVCSICSEKGKFHKLDPWNDEECGHWPGDVYDDKICLAISLDMTYKELSFVNAPADSASGIHEVSLGEDRITDWLCKDHDGKQTMESMSSSLDFYLVGDQGHKIFLDTDRYELTKTSVDLGQAQKPNVDDNQGEEDDQDAGVDDTVSYSDEEFARLHVLSSLNDRCFINLMKQEAKDVAKFKTAKLSQDRINQMESSVKVGPGQSFPLCSVAHVDAAKSFLKRYQGPGSKSSALAEINTAADQLGFKTSPSSTQKNNKGVPMKLRKNVEDCTDVDQLQSNWNDTLDTIEGKELALTAANDQIESLKKTIEEQSATISTMLADQHAKAVDQLIVVRTRLGRKATTETDEEKKKAYRDSLLKRSPEYIADAIEEESQALEEMLSAQDQEKLNNPLGDHDNSTDGKPEIKVTKNTIQNDSEETFDMNSFC